MGRTVPSFRIVLEMEKEEWKPFRNALNKSQRKMFDEMWDIPRFYISACSNSVQYVRLHPILISILFHHYKELIRCSKELIRCSKSKLSQSDENEKVEQVEGCRNSEEAFLRMTFIFCH